jgi:hypothetical protein
MLSRRWLSLSDLFVIEYPKVHQTETHVTRQFCNEKDLFQMAYL